MYSFFLKKTVCCFCCLPEWASVCSCEVSWSSEWKTWGHERRYWKKWAKLAIPILERAGRVSFMRPYSQPYTCGFLHWLEFTATSVGSSTSLLQVWVDCESDKYNCFCIKSSRNPSTKNNLCVFIINVFFLMSSVLFSMLS